MAVAEPRFWRSIAARAATLSERIAAYQDNNSSTEVVGQDVVALWMQVTADGKESRFAARLAHLGLNLGDVPGCLADPNFVEQPVPSWCELLADVAVEPTPLCADVIDKRPESLPDFLAPLVSGAFRRLVIRQPDLESHESLELRRDLCQQLQHRLVTLVQTCVDREHRNCRTRPTDSDSWSRWVSSQVNNCYVEFWNVYPALARLVATTMQLWVERSNELLTRASKDLDSINGAFGLELRRLVGARQGLADSHNGHADVADCVFVDREDARHHVIYKPKDVTAEAVFADLVDWANGQGIDVGRPLGALPRHGYGWVEKVTNIPAADASEVETFYRRCGALVALLYALGGTDFTPENVVAHGDTPVIIDAETVMRPVLLPEGRVPGDELPGNAEPPPSVLDSMFLPRWIRMGKNAIDSTALGSAEAGVQPRSARLVWREAGTADAQLVTVRDVEMERNCDLRDASGAVVVASDHQQSLLDGLAAAWAVLAELGQAALEPGGPLSGFVGVPIRKVIRRTSMYFHLHLGSLKPELLTNGLNRSLHLEVLARYALTRRDRTQSLALVEAEREQLEIGDIPIFTSPSTERALILNGVRAIEFEASAIERASLCLESMAPSQARQQKLAKSALAVACPGIRLHELAEQVRTGDAVSVDAPDMDEIRRACSNLVDDIAAAKLAAGGTTYLYGLTPATTAQWSVGSLDPGFCEGISGVAAALFAAANALRDTGIEDLAAELLGAAVADTLTRFDRLAQIRGLGAENGIGGIMFGWALSQRLATTVSARTYLHESLSELVGRTSPTLLYRPQPNDWRNGRLGLLVGLQAAADQAVEVRTELADVASASVAPEVAASLADGLLSVASEPIGDMLDGGIAGDAERLRASGSSQHVFAIANLTDRTLRNSLQLGVPRPSPLDALGLYSGKAGVLYALAASLAPDEIPNLSDWQV